MIDNLSSQALCGVLSDKVLAALRPLVAGRRRYGLLDFPHHWNIGDSAIWAGEIALMTQLFGRGPDYVSLQHHDPSEPGRVLGQEDILFLHGGGNFGDIWFPHQVYGAAVLRNHPNHRIIHLPQSIHFNDLAKLEEIRRAVALHQDYHLMVRDQESYAFATKHLECPVHLVPDSAFGIDMTLQRRNPRPEGIFGLFRTDKELRADAKEGRAHFSDCRVEDWGKLSFFRRGTDKVLRDLFLRPPFTALQTPRLALFNTMAQARVNLGFSQLDQAEVVVTDRLHGHIMSTLLGKPHVVIDNYYGKITRFIDAFGKDDVTLQARDYAEAREMADDLLRRVRKAKA